MADQIRCAVVDCLDRGGPRTCPYDGRYHRHGRIHYGTIPSSLTFHKGAWDYLCYGHYVVLVRELDAAHRESVRAGE